MGVPLCVDGNGERSRHRRPLEGFHLWHSEDDTGLPLPTREQFGLDDDSSARFRSIIGRHRSQSPVFSESPRGSRPRPFYDMLGPRDLALPPQRPESMGREYTHGPPAVSFDHVPSNYDADLESVRDAPLLGRMSIVSLLAGDRSWPPQYSRDSRGRPELFRSNAVRYRHGRDVEFDYEFQTRDADSDNTSAVTSPGRDRAGDADNSIPVSSVRQYWQAVTRANGGRSSFGIAPPRRPHLEPMSRTSRLASRRPYPTSGEHTNLPLPPVRILETQLPRPANRCHVKVTREPLRAGPCGGRGMRSSRLLGRSRNNLIPHLRRDVFVGFIDAPRNERPGNLPWDQLNSWDSSLDAQDQEREDSRHVRFAADAGSDTT